MEVIVQKPKKGSLEYTLEVTFSPKGIEQKIEKKLVNLSKTVKMPGFRPGKIPLNMIQSKYGDEVKWEIVQEATQHAYRDALIQENITPAGMGHFEKLNYDDLNTLSFTAIVEAMPDIADFKLETIKINRYLPLITEEEVAEQVKKYQSYARKWESKLVGSLSEEGDQVVLDFVGTLADGSSFDGNSANDFPVVLGENQMLPEFEKALYGCKEGELKSVTFTFPKDYAEATLSDKEVTFNLTIKTINRALLPDLDDAEFLKTMGIEEGGSEKLTSMARSECAIALEQTLNSFNNRLVQDVLLTTQDFLIPKGHIEEETQHMIAQQQKQANATSQEPTQELSKEQLERIDKQAYERCKLSLVYQKIVQQYDIKPDVKAIAHRLQQLCQNYFNGDFKAFEKSPQLPQVRKELEHQNMMEQIHNKVFEHAKVNDIETGKADLEKLSKEVFAEK